MTNMTAMEFQGSVQTPAASETLDKREDLFGRIVLFKGAYDFTQAYKGVERITSPEKDSIAIIIQNGEPLPDTPDVFAVLFLNKRAVLKDSKSAASVDTFYKRQGSSQPPWPTKPEEIELRRGGAFPNGTPIILCDQSVVKETDTEITQFEDFGAALIAGPSYERIYEIMTEGTSGHNPLFFYGIQPIPCADLYHALGTGKAELYPKGFDPRELASIEDLNSHMRETYMQGKTAEETELLYATMPEMRAN